MEYRALLASTLAEPRRCPFFSHRSESHQGDQLGGRRHRSSPPGSAIPRESLLGSRANATGRRARREVLTPAGTDPRGSVPSSHREAASAAGTRAPTSERHVARDRSRRTERERGSLRKEWQTTPGRPTSRLASRGRSWAGNRGKSSLHAWPCHQPDPRGDGPRARRRLFPAARPAIRMLTPGPRVLSAAARGC